MWHILSYGHLSHALSPCLVPLTSEKCYAITFPSAVIGLQVLPALGSVSGRNGDEVGRFGVGRLSPGVQAVGWASVVGKRSLSPAVAV